MVKGSFFSFRLLLSTFLSNCWSLVSTVQPLNTSHSTLDRTCSDSVVTLSGRKSTSDLTTVTESSEMPATASHHRRRGSSKVSSFFVLFSSHGYVFLSSVFLHWFEFNSKKLIQVIISRLNRKNHQTETLISCASSLEIIDFIFFRLVSCHGTKQKETNSNKSNVHLCVCPCSLTLSK